ncbi:hypothetical protein RCC89_08345 [Cytophagaceae bacterium ABcell3]|nr:hypothetical protein RCC89_08345 [Cytophagaceae bacterium ABcell3]
MAGCGYVCPSCNNSGFDEAGNACHWCRPVNQSKCTEEPNKDEDIESWLENVHGGSCCWDDNDYDDESEQDKDK